MYVKIRKLGGVKDDPDTIINISKMSSIQELKQTIEKETGVDPKQQMLLYKGKQLVDGHRIIDYNISLNDIIQLMVKTEPLTEDLSKTEQAKRENKQNNETVLDIESKFYKVGDAVDVQFEDNGAWYEADIIRIFIKGSNGENVEEDNLIFKVRNAEHVMCFEAEMNFKDIRPRSYYVYKNLELWKGMVVLANYNIEEPKSRGPWFDFEIENVSRTSITGTLLVGRDKTPIKNCSIKFIDEIMRIEQLGLLTNRMDQKQKLMPRKYPYYCTKCRDDKSKNCRECGCRVCAGKENCDTMILCDECDYGYHIACLSPPLESVPKDDDWYCPNCKTDDSEIVKAGENLKASKKKAKMASSSGDCNRDWGKGMACVGRTKECTIVPKNHYGPVPGVEVGTCWKFRLQVSEAGVHRPHVAGIHGRETDGAYSLILSGGYEDDIDNGEEFSYTGSGGRDLSGNKRISEQSCDQKLTRMNKALALNCNAPFNSVTGAESKNWKEGKPVRVIRNYKNGKHSKYGPEDGNRYDGIYKVVKYYPERGKSGFIVWKYLLRRDDPNPAPWEKNGQELEMIYPPGYLEAQKAQAEKSDKENTSKSISTPKRGLKRKALENTQLITTFINSPKKPKVAEYKLTPEMEGFISEDIENDKLWLECKPFLKEGKQKFLSKVEEIFMCICCQEVVFQPVTTECKHNICKACLKRSFASEIYSCPYCRNELGKDYNLKINEPLGNILKLLFPGYEATR